MQAADCGGLCGIVDCCLLWERWGDEKREEGEAETKNSFVFWLLVKDLTSFEISRS